MTTYTATWGCPTESGCNTEPGVVFWRRWHPIYSVATVNSTVHPKYKSNGTVVIEDVIINMLVHVYLGEWTIAVYGMYKSLLS